MKGYDADVLVIGSGIAGLTFALKAAERHSVLLLTKKERADSNTNYARGGIAAVMAEDDGLDLHIRDTLAAGAGLCHPEMVEMVVREGPARARELVDWGVRFRREGEGFSLGREGGHSRRRILHAGDRTGREIERALLAAVDEGRIRILEDHLAVELLLDEGPDGPRCVGVAALDHSLGRREVLHARATLLATGGCGQAYRHTTNPSIATGDGVAMAFRAGADVANMEFIQFHPTALYPTEDPAFLISEALRGEGAVLRRLDGEPFMDGHHELGSLAPRDVVARAIDAELKATGEPHVVLDVSAISRKVMEKRFPGALEGCLERGIDPWKSGIPVVPAAHYVCGGVVTDEDGRTSVPGLYAAGEVACTGVHGANRLASNSLIEAVVFSHRAAGAVLDELDGAGDGGRVKGTLPGGGSPEGGAAVSAADTGSGPGIAEARGELRDLMWSLVGIVRSDDRLEVAHRAVTELAARDGERWHSEPWTPEGVELHNLLETAGLIVECARRRRESRGLHFNVDHPNRDDEGFRGDTVVEGTRPPASPLSRTVL